MKFIIRKLVNLFESLNILLSLRAKMWISIVFGVVAPIVVDHVAKLFGVDDVWEMVILAVEVSLPATMFYLLWHEVHRLQERAFIDPLTGLLNRRGGDDALRRELSTIFRQFGGDGRRKVKVAMAFIDVDHLKMINDSYGHPVGDKVIQEVGQILRNAFPRGIDIVVRRGGDEFLVMVPQMKAEDLKKKIEDCSDGKLCLSNAIRDSEELQKLTHGAGITLSIGISSGYVSQDEKTWADDLAPIISRADQALYIVKDNNRNGILILRRKSANQDLTISDE